MSQKLLDAPEPLLTDPLNIHNNNNKALFRQLVHSVEEGDSLILSGNFIEAEKTYKRGISVCKNMCSPWHEILLYNRIGFVNFWITDLDESQKYYYQSLTIMKEQSEILDSIAFAEAVVMFCLNSRYNKDYELDLSKEQLQLDFLRETILLSPGRKLKYHFLLVLNADTESDFEKLNSEIRNAEHYLDDLPSGNKFWPFLVRYYQGLYYKRLNDYDLAIRYFNELEHKVQYEKELRPFRYHVYINQVFLNSQLQHYKLAAEYAQKLQYFLPSENIQPFFYSDYVLIGEVYKNLGFHTQALKSFRIAEEILTGNGIYDENLVYVYYFMAMYYKEVEKDQEIMLNYLRMAEDLMIRCNSPYLETFIVYELGKYYYNQEAYDLAIVIFNLILDDTERLLNDEKYFKIQYPYLSRSPYLNVLHYRGASFFKLSKQKKLDMITLENSYKDYQYLLLLHEKMFREHGYEESRIASLRKVRNDFESLFEVGFTLYELTKKELYLEELFSYSERSKAYMLKNYISDEQAKRIGGIPETMIDKARTIKKNIDSLQYSFNQKILQNERTSDELLVNEILQKQDEYDRFIRLLEEKYPAYALMKYRSSGISVYTIQEQMKSDQALIEYFFTEDAFYMFFIDQDTIILTYQPAAIDLPQQILDYRRSIDGLTFNRMNTTTIKEFINRSYALYSLAMKPVEHRISQKRLVIIPDEELSLIPFETLIQKHPDSLINTSLKDLPYLIMKNPICYLYSASQIANKSRTHFTIFDYAGFAPAYSNVNSAEHDVFPEPLPGALDEVFAANRYFRGKVYTDKEIDKALYFKESRRREILHLAMHVQLDSVESMNSKFIFSPAIDLDEKQLHAYEVYARKIIASLVVLSACNTGMGEMNEGEGVFSIARAYVLAGVQNVLYTQWSITDRSSAQLMDRFYYYLSRRVPTDIALQKAKIDFILRGDPVKTLPYYWAGYTIMGNPMKIPIRNKALLLAGLIFLAVLVGYLVYIRRLRSVS